MTEQFELSEFLDAPSAPYYCRFKASNIGQCLYKICDDTVSPRNFLDADNEDEIEAILSDREGHSLHEFIDGDEPLWPIIDFVLPQEVLDTIGSKLTHKEVLDSLILAFRKICLEIFLKWNPKTIVIASSSNVKKMSYHISTFGEHVHVKKAICPKDGSIFNFMIRPPNYESEVVKSSFLDITEPKVQRFDDTNSETTQAEFELVKTLLQEARIKGYSLSYPSETTNFHYHASLHRTA
ncbi:unnamed protein product [Rhizophagus irregularis]|nr:unnamed protein product [Rhizophagus irregularis]